MGGDGCENTALEQKVTSLACERGSFILFFFFLNAPLGPCSEESIIIFSIPRLFSSEFSSPSYYKVNVCCIGSKFMVSK